MAGLRRQNQSFHDTTHTQRPLYETKTGRIVRMDTTGAYVRAVADQERPAARTATLVRVVQLAPVPYMFRCSYPTLTTAQPNSVRHPAAVRAMVALPPGDGAV